MYTNKNSRDDSIQVDNTRHPKLSLFHLVMYFMKDVGMFTSLYPDTHQKLLLHSSEIIPDLDNIIIIIIIARYLSEISDFLFRSEISDEYNYCHSIGKIHVSSEISDEYMARL